MSELPLIETSPILGASLDLRDPAARHAEELRRTRTDSVESGEPGACAPHVSISGSQWEIRQGDALALLREMPDASVDAIVTDPPYGIGFMGKEWDGAAIAEAAQRDRKSARSASAFGSAAHYAGPVRAGADFQHWCSMWSAEALRVAKPGAHLVAFGGSRTYHRLACAIEDAGWEVRDCLMWLYGSGFPKSLDVSKAIDKAAGAERVVVQRRRVGVHFDPLGQGGGGWSAGEAVVSLAATDAAREWQGWGTALKPAHEPIILARKPLAGTVAANVLEHGTGALNIDGCRVAAASGSPAEARRATARRTGNAPVSIRSAAEASADGRIENRARPEVYMAARPGESIGRWPANVLLDSEAAEALDEQSGERPGMPRTTKRKGESPKGYGEGWGPDDASMSPGFGDLGGASRFFYTAKASASERHAQGRNAHPTVKPVDLMRWLCRLVTPRGGLVLDPFTGSGSTGVAALAEGFRFLGLEREADYCAMARRRIAGPLFAEIEAIGEARR